MVIVDFQLEKSNKFFEMGVKTWNWDQSFQWILPTYVDKQVCIET